MKEPEKPSFDAAAYLASTGPGPQARPVCTQADPLCAGGRCRFRLLHPEGQRAGYGGFVGWQRSDDHAAGGGRFLWGEESLAAAEGQRMASATALTVCCALKIRRDEMIRAMHEEHELSDLFLKFLLARSMRIQADWWISFSTRAKSGWRGFWC